MESLITSWKNGWNCAPSCYSGTLLHKIIINYCDLCLHIGDKYTIFENGWIFVTFFLLSNLLKTVQYVLVPWSRSVSLQPRYFNYFSFALAIIFDVSLRTVFT